MGNHSFEIMKTLPEHREYLYEISKLQLWFAWSWKSKNKEESFKSILRDRIDIYRKTDINKGGSNPEQTNFEDPDWLSLEASFKKTYEMHCSSDISFENEAFDYVKPFIDLRLDRDYNETAYHLDYKCGSLTYNEPQSEISKRVYIHISNALSPKSLFSDKNYLPKCLIELMDKSEAEHGANSLETDTWLNSNSKWTELFPKEWSDNMGSQT